MKYMNFIMKLVGALAVVAILFCYQNVAVKRAAVVAERESEIAEVEAYNSEILAQKQALEEKKAQESAAESTEEGTEETVPMKDGTYTGEGQGYGGPVTVTLVVSGEKITSVSIGTHDGEDEEYFTKVQDLTSQVLADQSSDRLDTVSGATASSQGLIDAINDAILQAKEG